MELTNVASSHIAAIGYLESDRVLLVRYKDGALYARLGWSPEHYAAMHAAASKGKFLNATPGASILIMKGGNAEDSQSTRAALPLAVADQSGPLNMIDEDADKCCRKSLAASLEKFPNATIMACGDCGQEFKVSPHFPQLYPIRYWQISPSVVIVRPRR